MAATLASHELLSAELVANEVPQGCMFDPFSFFVYMNNLGGTSYADDAAFYYRTAPSQWASSSVMEPGLAFTRSFIYASFCSFLGSWIQSGQRLLLSTRVKTTTPHRSCLGLKMIRV